MATAFVTTATHDLDYRLTQLRVTNVAAMVQGWGYAYADGINLTGITDQVTAANSNVLSYTASNRLSGATGTWGSSSYSYDAVGNCVNDITGAPTNVSRIASYATTSNRIIGMTENGAGIRDYTYDGVGNIITDTRPGEVFVYGYSAANRMASVTRNGQTLADYKYNALEQLVSRISQSPAAPIGEVHYIYDLDGHLIAEIAAATGVTQREYVWMPSNDNNDTTLASEIGLVPANDNSVDLPLAVIEAGDMLHVHSDHLGRPTRLTNSAKATVWQAVYKPWGEVQTITGTTVQNLRFPGQYFQVETGLAYNWHRSYDPITGRYTQPDPLGFVDGPSVYTYAGNSPWMNVDPTGLELLGGARPHGCSGPWNRFGNDAHKALRAAIESIHGVGRFRFNSSYLKMFTGRPDVFDPMSGGTWELKPTTYGSGAPYQSATSQLSGYVNSYNSRNYSGPMAYRGSWSSLFGGSSFSFGGFTFYPDNRSRSGLLFYSCNQQCGAGNAPTGLPNL